MNRRIKVVWLCHMVNEKLNDYFGTNLNMTAYWMTQFLDVIKGRNIDIHIVAPNYFTNKKIEFELEGVHYHLYKYYSGIIKDPRYAYLEIALRRQRNIIEATSELIDSIAPDIIHLFGAENITYSSGVLPYIEKTPVLVSFQGYIQLAEQKGSFLRNYVINKRSVTESEILKHCKYISFGEFEGSSRNYYENNYGSAKIYPINFPFKKAALDATTVKKEFDVVFWGRVTVDKGVEDLLQAMLILKKKRPDIRCLILGGGSEEYMKKLRDYVSSNSLSENVVFGGFQRTDEELFSNAAKALVYVLPTHYDALPGSIRESMLLKLPVVTYPVGDIPLLNKTKQCVLLADYLDVNSLAGKIDSVLTDEELRSELIVNAFEQACLYGSGERIADQIEACYREILNG